MVREAGVPSFEEGQGAHVGGKNGRLQHHITHPVRPGNPVLSLADGSPQPASVGPFAYPCHNSPSSPRINVVQSEFKLTAMMSRSFKYRSSLPSLTMRNLRQGFSLAVVVATETLEEQQAPPQ